MPKISVIMPTFNDRGYLKEAVQSVLDQSFKDFELIIKDGSPHPSFLSLPRNEKIKVIWGKDRGITDAMNTAMKIATGDIFCWANDDDLMDKDALQTVIDNIGDNKWLYGNIEMFNGGQAFIWGGDWDYERLKEGNFVPQPAVYWTKEAYREVGEMSEENDLVSDYEYWLRLGSKYEPKRINNIMARYRVHKDQITVKITAEQLRQADNIKKLYANTNNR